MSNGTITMTGAEYDALVGKIAALEAELAKLRAGQEPVRFWFIGDAGQQKGATYCKKSSRDGSLAFFECEEDAKRAALRHPGTEVYPVEYYRKPQATPQPSAVPDGDIFWREKLAIKFCEARGILDGSKERASVVDAFVSALSLAPSAPATVQPDPAKGQGGGWQFAADALPATGKPVLAYYLNSHGMGRRIRAMHVKRFTVEAEEFADPDTQRCEYSEQDDCYYTTEGWYELIDNWPDYASCAVIEGVITHWMPLPAAPAIAAARQEGGKV